VIRKRWRS